MTRVLVFPGPATNFPCLEPEGFDLLSISFILLSMPDTRFDLELKDLCTFRVFSDTLESGGIIKVLCVLSGALKKGDIYNEAVESGAKGLPFLKVLDNGKGITLDRLRGYVAHDLGLIDHCRHSILWINDFPMFEWNDSENRLEALHHPFTAPNPEDMNDLASAPALAYDMVYNGVEIGGGSLRIYKRDIQQKVLEIVGISMEQDWVLSQFGT
ncbi:hypothetical protein L6164_005779 [Bauhinia variegata]|uniref:Uncharacterized protein n=1 Tax=Bauhinia variegata TaxID=167791 RepID=A0ACB9PXR6_BAUVA|nr:hypothetical protein L6164_005779 [Bauhinia variegata]